MSLARLVAQTGLFDVRSRWRKLCRKNSGMRWAVVVGTKKNAPTYFTKKREKACLSFHSLLPSYQPRGLFSKLLLVSSLQNISLSVCELDSQPNRRPRETQKSRGHPGILNSEGGLQHCDIYVVCSVFGRSRTWHRFEELQENLLDRCCTEGRELLVMGSMV